ncbi:hypothetical protein QRZ34_27360 [Klebsiella michiganensis]|nr:hypothetical protein [Klebsiella michiganensis]MDL4454757.1 hypothetical protein [Klebsiella michiganensis]
MWLPLQGTFDRSPFSYDEAHDHNFDFWTVNFTGSGYRTRLYNYDYEGVVGINGETVTLNCYGDKKLTQDTVMFYIRSKDVHTQYPPDELSASLNLIVKSVKAPHQYEFEIESDVLAGKTEATIKKGRFERYAFQRVLYNGLLKLDNETSRQLVNKVTYCNQCEEIRSIAYDALLNYLKIKGSNDDIRKIRDQVFKDPSSYVKNQIMYRIGSMLSA